MSILIKNELGAKTVLFKSSLLGRLTFSRSRELEYVKIEDKKLTPDPDIQILAEQKNKERQQQDPDRERVVLVHDKRAKGSKFESYTELYGEEVITVGLANYFILKKNNLTFIANHSLRFFHQNSVTAKKSQPRRRQGQRQQEQGEPYFYFQLFFIFFHFYYLFCYRPPGRRDQFLVLRLAIHTTLYLCTDVMRIIYLSFRINTRKPTPPRHR